HDGHLFSVVSQQKGTGRAFGALYRGAIMTERQPPNPLDLLKETVMTPLPSEAEAERRRRVVSRIDALRAELSAGLTPSVAAAEHTTRAQHPHLSAVWEGAKPSALKRRTAPLKWAAAALAIAAALLLYFQANEVPAPLLRVTGGELT